MADFDPNQFVEGQRQDWNRVSSAWEKWDAWFDVGFESCNRHLVDRARLGPGHHVLDLGSGTGYPGIPAAQRVGPKGHVTGIDLAEEMLEVARRKAEKLGLKQITFRQSDVASLSFEAGRFDAVTSRFCLMFLPRLDKTLREVHRVLKPGGAVAAAVWAAREKNPYITIPMGVLREYIEIPPVDPAVPGIFYLERPGDLLGRMKAAGFTELREEEIPIEGVFSSGREYLDCLKEMAAPLQGLFEKVPREKRTEVEEKMVQGAERFRRGGEVRIPGVALAVSGIKSL
ncbi:MAG TPA: methyltransferase domain-containing protein [Nitrospiria bacterium]|jgi:ubiquinone/menaquinone biosynthesis C-methylase UbiE|nr:methyltransferase domain-containing protein [Nitrospiria bacterium]